MILPGVSERLGQSLGTLPTSVSASIWDPAESKMLKVGDRVSWKGDAADFGTVTETTWHGVNIAWDNGKVGIVHHGDMGAIQRAAGKPKAVTKDQRTSRN